MFRVLPAVRAGDLSLLESVHSQPFTGVQRGVGWCGWGVLCKSVITDTLEVKYVKYNLRRVLLAIRAQFFRYSPERIAKWKTPFFLIDTLFMIATVFPISFTVF